MKKILYITYYLRGDYPTSSRRSYNNCRFIPDGEYQIDVITSKSLNEKNNRLFGDEMRDQVRVF